MLAPPAPALRELVALYAPTNCNLEMALNLEYLLDWMPFPGRPARPFTMSCITGGVRGGA